MSQIIIPVDPFDYVVFGGTGDLAERKLLPALYHRQMAGQLTDPTRIIGASRSEMSHDEYRGFARDALKQHLKAGEYHDDEVETFLARLFYVAVDARSEKGWPELKALLDEGQDRVRAFYLAVGPALFGDISEKIRSNGLVTDETRIVVEKPIGRDLESARTLNRTIGEGVLGRADLPHRPLSRQGDGAEPDGAEVCQRALRTAVELGAYRPCADNGGGIGRAGRPGRLLRQGGRAQRYGAEPPGAALVPRRHGASGPRWTRKRCATRS